MSMDGVPTIGQPQFAKPVLLRAADGTVVVVPQVFVAQLNLQILQEIAARCAVATASEVRKEFLKVLIDAGIIPPQPEEKEPNATEAMESNPAENTGGVT